jgi:arylsulfatase A-like enzyme
VFLRACLASLASACSAEDGSRPQNVLLVTLDTTRADHLSCYGAPAGATPALDQLAAAGTRFDLALSTASVTPVSHAAILTGLDNHEHGLRVLFAGSGYRLRSDVDTLATTLAAHGYDTRAVHSAFPVSRFFGLERGFAHFDDLEATIEERRGEYRWDVGAFQRRSDETTERALAQLHGGPFYLWVHYWDPHDFARLPPGLTQMDVQAAGIEHGVQPFYAEEVRYVDTQLGRLFAGLRERGLEDETLVIVVADHGQGLLDHGWPAHRLLYQEQIRVPLIVRAPGLAQVPVVSELVRTIDLYPTVLELLGLAPPRPVSGRSLVPLLEGRADEPRRALADQLNGYDWNAGMVRERPLDDFLYALVERNWKLVYRPRAPTKSELFQLSTDPQEVENLFLARPEEARRMLGLLAEAAPWATEPFAAPSEGAGARDALAQLGYSGTDAVEAAWAWTCASHREAVRAERVPCPQCGAAPLLVSPAPPPGR